MNKLALCQVILGILVIAAAGFILGWMTMDLPALEAGPDPANPDASYWQHDSPAYLTASKYLAGLLVLLGAVIVATGSFQSRPDGDNLSRLAVFQLLAGTLTLFISFVVLAAILPSRFVLTSPGGQQFLGTTTTMWQEPRTIAAFCAVVIGLAVVSIGFSQHIRAGRKPRGRKPRR